MVNCDQILSEASLVVGEEAVIGTWPDRIGSYLPFYAHLIAPIELTMVKKLIVPL